MTDIVDSKTRSRMMSGIGTANTKPEMIVRKLLFAQGFRYRLHRKDLPGKPDLVLPKYEVAVFVHGCFWHCHECHLFKWPKSNAAFWKKKILGNRERDARNVKELRSLGWHVMTVWECAVRSRSETQLTSLSERMSRWIEAESSLYRAKQFCQ